MRHKIQNPSFKGYELVGTTGWYFTCIFIFIVPLTKYEIRFQKKPWYKFW